MRPSPVASLRAYLIALTGLFLYSVMLTALSSIGVRLGFFSYVVNIAFQWLAFALPALLYYQKNTSLQPSMRMFPLSPARAAIIVATAAIGTLALNWVSLYWVMILEAFGLVVNIGNDILPSNGTELLWFLIYGALAPAAFEEVLFRGFLMPSFETRSRKAAVWVSALLFALLHGSIEALPTHILLGAILAILTLNTGSLFAPMLYHASHNGIVMLLGYYANKSAGANEALPTVAEAVAAVPGVIMLLSLWGVFLSFAMRGDTQGNEGRLPPADVIPFSKLAKVMLFAVAAILLALQVTTVLHMLPEAA